MTPKVMRSGSFGSTGASTVLAEPAQVVTVAATPVATSAATIVSAAALQQVALCAESTTVADLQSLRATRPPAAMREVVETCLMLLGYRDTKWSAAQAHFGRPEDFLKRLRSFDASKNVSRLQYQKLCRSLSGLQGTLDKRPPESCSGAALARWCSAVYDVLASRFGGVPRLSSSSAKLRERERARSPEAHPASLLAPSDGISSSSAAGGASLGGQRTSSASATVDGAGDMGPGNAPMQTSMPLPYRSDFAATIDEERGSQVESPRAKSNSLLEFRSQVEAQTRPDLGDLQVWPDVYSMTPAQLRRVANLTIRKPDVGEVTFPCEIDLSRETCTVLDELPNIIRLDPGEVVLYPDPGTKPLEGEGLNRPATITLFQCMPPNNGLFPDADSKARYRERIARMTEQKGARFVDYDCDRGIWQFRVDHF